MAAGPTGHRHVDACNSSPLGVTQGSFAVLVIHEI